MFSFDPFWGVSPMSEFPQPRYSESEVVKAGKALKGDVSWDEENVQDLRHVFRVANNWRDSHAYPTHMVRRALIGKMNSGGRKGLTAARLKRMSSIRKKLRGMSINLNRIQDLGGCRSILASMDDVRSLVQDLVSDFGPHVLHKQSDHITKPKAGGYRSHHLIFRYGAERADASFAGRLIELQIRSRLQHSWATAVEAIGLFNGDDLKGGNGDPNWLRFFELIASELAIAENCPELDGAPSHEDRVREIRDLDKFLSASSALNNLRQIVNYTDNYYSPEKGNHYLIRYDRDRSSVQLQAFHSALLATAAYDKAEKEARQSSGRLTVVLVEVSKLNDLMTAYPNYYGDVSIFVENLGRIVSGREAKEYKLPPQERAPPPPTNIPDQSWFRRSHKR